MNIVAVVLLLLFLATAFFIIISHLNKAKFIKKNNLSNKIKIYTLVEFIYTENKMIDFITQLNNNNDIKIYTMLFYKNLIYRYRIKFSDNWALFSGLFILFLFASIPFIHITYFDFEIYFIVMLALMIILNYNESITKKISFYEDRILLMHDFLNNYKIIKDTKEKEKLLQEIFIDLELHKNNQSGYTVVLSIISLIMTYYLDLKIYFGFVLLLVLWAVINFMYIKYKSDILYLAHNTLLRYEVSNE